MSSEQFEERITRVLDLTDPRLEDYRDLREADLAARRQSFIAESEVVLRVLLDRGRYPVKSLLIAAPRLAKLAPLIVDLDPSISVFVAEQAMLDKVVGFHIHRGVLAAGERLPVSQPASLLASIVPQARRIVVLEGLTNHDNVGGVFRNAAAFGADAVLIDAKTCDPLYRKAIRVSVGASLFVPYARLPADQPLLDAVHASGFTSLALSPHPKGVDIAAFGTGRPLPQKVALVLGSEGPGLTAETMAAAHQQVRIAIEPLFDSLNVATASGVALHALRSVQRGPAP